jgi:thiamine-phosphate diphosphorylase/hydroxyethylthiazole kinase
MELDYSLYLVTDSTPAILGNRSLTDTVEEAIKGGSPAKHPGQK